MKISRNPVSGKVGGPLWRFFEAVARPVMGEAMPAASSFPDIVDRVKHHGVASIKWWQVAEPEWFDVWLELTSRGVRLPARRKRAT